MSLAFAARAVHLRCGPGTRPGITTARMCQMTSLPVLLDETTLGIVIRTPSAAARPVRFWAYLWASDDASEGRPWHERVPVERVAA